MTRFARYALGMALMGVTTAAVAQGAPATRIRGMIEAVDGPVLTVKTPYGREVRVKLADPFTAAVVVRASLADIKPNSFIGTAAVPKADGTLEALEIHIFREDQRGAGEGHREYDLAPQSTMTNGAVGGIVESTHGRTLTITYHGGERKVVVPPSAPIVTYVPGKPEDVKPGVGIIVQAAAEQPDGSFTASRITVGRDGVDPPM